MILSKEHEAKLQPETEDNMGNPIEQFEHSDTPPIAEFEGAISESLWRYLQSEPLNIVGLSEVTGRKVTVQLTLSNAGYINAETLVFGAGTGRRFCIAWQTKEGRWLYTKKMVDVLEEGYTELNEDGKMEQHDLTLNHWKAMVHTYVRV